MNGGYVKEIMEQIHISEEMQEGIMVNVQNCMKTGKYKKTKWRKALYTAAAFAFAAGVISFPARALVTSVVKERMDSIPKEEVWEMNDMVQSMPVEADTFSREFSDSEKERDKALRQEYKNGKFPEYVIAQAEDAQDAPEGTLCYIGATGVFNLPDREMTDEEILEIIDFQHQMSYAVSQSTAAKEAGAEMHAKENRLREKIRTAGGISEEEAIEIARKQLKTDLGDRADGLELVTDGSGSGVSLLDAADYAETLKLESKAGVIYDVAFGDPDTHFIYGYSIDAVDGSILYTYPTESPE